MRDQWIIKLACFHAKPQRVSRKDVQVYFFESFKNSSLRALRGFFFAALREKKHSESSHPDIFRDKKRNISCLSRAMVIKAAPGILATCLLSGRKASPYWLALVGKKWKIRFNYLAIIKCVANDFLYQIGVGNGVIDFIVLFGGNGPE